MASLSTLKSKLQGAVPDFERVTGKLTSFIRGNPITSTAILSATATGATALAVAATSKRKRKKSTAKKRKSKSKRRRRKVSRRKTKRKRQKQPRTAGKRKDRSTRRIRYTKNNQPYVILRSGKARFIKKSTARRAKKLKGGMY